MSSNAANATGVDLVPPLPLPLWAAEGRSILRWLGADLPVPDHTTVTPQPVAERGDRVPGEHGEGLPSGLENTATWPGASGTTAG